MTNLNGPTAAGHLKLNRAIEFLPDDEALAALLAELQASLPHIEVEPDLETMETTSFERGPEIEVIQLIP